jgi:hypothetical protein
MKVDLRLDLYALSRRIIRDLWLIETTKKEFELKGYDFDDYDEEDETNFALLDLIDIDSFFKDVISDKEKYLARIDAVRRMCKDLLVSADKHKHRYNFVEYYFQESSEYQEISQKIKSSISSDDENYYFSYLYNLSRFFPYYPIDDGDYSFKSPAKIKCENTVEESLSAEGDYTQLMNFRDYIFSFGYYPNDSYLDGKPFTDIELAGREILSNIILEGYWKLIQMYDQAFRQLVQNVKQAIDDKWDILSSKYNRGRYYDEWGLLHEESWFRDLRYFAINIVANSNQLYDFFLYIELDEKNIATFINYRDDLDYTCLSLSPKSDSELWELKNLSPASRKIHLEDFVVNLCSMLFTVKLSQVSQDDEINNKANTIAQTTNLGEMEREKSEIGRIFEFKIKEQLENHGYTISLTPITGDQGVDIIATRNGQKYAIQCKSYSGQVGNAAVQEVIAGKIFYDCDYACVITNSNFTPSAYQLAAKAGVIMCANENLESLK